MKTIVAYGIVPISRTRVRCVICAVCIPRAVKCVDQHIFGSKHDDNFQFMTENGVYIREDVVYCKACDVYLSEKESVLTHIDKVSHNLWWDMADEIMHRDYICFDDFLASENADTAFCKLCQMEIRCTKEFLMGHVDMVSHTSKLLAKVMPNNGVFFTENTDEAWCKICEKYISNKPSVILDHVEKDSRHMEWFMDYEDVIQDQEISLAKYLANKFEPTAYCKKCKIGVPCKILDLTRHVKGASHLYNLAQFEPL